MILQPIVESQTKTMIISRANKNGGPRLKGFPYGEDPHTGYRGYRVGYCDGCNNPLFIRTLEVKEMMGEFGCSHTNWEPEAIKVPLRKRMAGWLIYALGGRVD